MDAWPTRFIGLCECDHEMTEHGWCGCDADGCDCDAELVPVVVPRSVNE